MHTDKPTSLSVRDYIIRRLSSSMRLNESDIAAVISHQYASGNAATKLYNEVEFSGLGKFLFAPKKAIKKREKLLSIKSRILSLIPLPGMYTELSESKIERMKGMVKEVDEQLEYIKTKLKEENVD